MLTYFIQSSKVFPQLLRFGIVGCFAAFINLLVVAILVEKLPLNPLLANIFAFILAFNISYFGHRHFSFAAIHLSHKTSLTKFLLVALASLTLNELLFAIFLNFWHFYYLFDLLLVLIIVPIFTFLLSKYWAFNKIYK